MLQSELFECVCYSDEHALKFILDPEEPSLCISIFLHKRNVFVRIWLAIKYVCGYKCKYGFWDCWELRREDTERLRCLLEKYLALTERG